MGDIKTTEAKVADNRPALSYIYSQPSTSSAKIPFVTSASRKGKNAIGTSDQKMPVKIIIADMKKTAKGVSFNESTQTYISVTDETANVLYIKESIKAKLQRDVTLVSGNGLELEEEEGTRGIIFIRTSETK